jgi:hypothetical protein
VSRAGDLVSCCRSVDQGIVPSGADENSGKVAGPVHHTHPHTHPTLSQTQDLNQPAHPAHPERHFQCCFDPPVYTSFKVSRRLRDHSAPVENGLKPISSRPWLHASPVRTGRSSRVPYALGRGAVGCWQGTYT